MERKQIKNNDNPSKNEINGGGFASYIKAGVKALGIILLTFIIIVASCGFLLWNALSGLCGIEIFQETYSPDEKYKAVVYQRDCGATTGFSTQISILKAGDSLPNKAGNLFGINGHPEWTETQVTWDDNRSLTVTYQNKYTIYRQKDKFRRFFDVIAVDYQGISE